MEKMKALHLVALTSLSLVSCSSSVDTGVSGKNSHEHDYAVTVVDPTCTNEGYKLYQCPCGFSYTDDVSDPLGHAWVERENNYKCSRCDKYEDGGYYFELITPAMSYGEGYEGRGNTYDIVGVSSEALENGKLTMPRKHLGLEVTGIAKGAFYNLKKETKALEIPANIKYIGSNLFNSGGAYTRATGDISLIEVVFDEGCVGLNVSHSAFANCLSLTSVEMPEECISKFNYDDSVGNHFLFEGTPYYENNKTEENGIYYISGILTESDPDDFYDTADIKAGTRLICNYSFSKNTNITKLVLPNSVEHIGQCAFYQCLRLSKIVYEGTADQYGSIDIHDTAFSGCPEIEIEFI